MIQDQPGPVKPFSGIIRAEPWILAKTPRHRASGLTGTGYTGTMRHVIFLDALDEGGGYYHAWAPLFESALGDRVFWHDDQLIDWPLWPRLKA